MKRFIPAFSCNDIGCDVFYSFYRKIRRNSIFVYIPDIRHRPHILQKKTGVLVSNTKDRYDPIVTLPCLTLVLLHWEK